MPGFPPLHVGLAGCQAGLEAMAFEEAMATIADAERAGLDGVWVNEEHLGGRSAQRPCWATLPFLAHLAGRVPRIRLGTAALILPLHHPLRLAEEVGSLCAFAPGRVALGVAPNRPGPYSAAFGTPAHETPDGYREDFDAHLAALTALLRGEQIDLATAGHVGRAASSAVVPDSGPRIFRAAYSPESVVAAARAGMPLVQHYIQSPASISAARQHYRSAAGAEADALLRESPVHRFVLIGEDDDAARRAARGFAVTLTERLRSFGIDRRGHVAEPAALEPDRFAAETAIVGSAATVLDRLHDLAARTGTGAVNVNLGWMGVVDHHHVTRSAAHLVDGVLPRLIPIGENHVQER